MPSRVLPRTGRGNTPRRCTYAYAEVLRFAQDDTSIFFSIHGSSLMITGGQYLSRVVTSAHSLYTLCVPTRIPTRARRLVSLPVSLDQLALTIGRLSPKDLEALELAFEPGEQRELLRRRKAVRGLAKKGKALSLDDLQAEFGGA